MKILTGFIAPSAGKASIQGHETLADPLAAQKCIGYLPENAPIYPDMRVRDYLRYIGRIRGLGKAELARAIERVATETGIDERLGQSVGNLSKGYRQRVGLAQALLHSPPILILDEPTTGLDLNQIVEIRNLIREIYRKRTVILSTHILTEVQATCDRVIIINRECRRRHRRRDRRTRGGVLLSVVFGAGTVALPDKVQVEDGSLDGVERVRVQEVEADTYAFEALASADIRRAVF